MMLAAQQPIAGVTPPEVREVAVMTIFPTLGAYASGRLMGQLCGVRAGFGFFTLGKLFAVLLIPMAIGVFVFSLLPGVIRRYTLTNRRVVIQKGLRAIDERWVDFDRFDAIDVEVLAGQEWYPAGDLIFRLGQIETFRLAGVSRPETFRHTCLGARRGYLGARQHS
jgi:hypothetical protein